MLCCDKLRYHQAAGTIVRADDSRLFIPQPADRGWIIIGPTDTEVLDGVRFCPFCGSSLDGTA